MIRQQRIENVAGAVDAVTEKHGLNRGEALYAFTSMLLTTLEETSPDVREAFCQAITASLEQNSIKPLSELLRTVRTH